MPYTNNYRELTVEQVEKYLERLELNNLSKEELTPSKALLDRLVDAHHKHICFENIDPYEEKIPISLEIDDLYEKIILRKRGGYCFEMNGLFINLLRTLGFEAWSCFCRVMHGHTVITGISHRGNIVALDGRRYFCDVGFGGPMPAGGLLLADGEKQVIGNETFMAEDVRNGWWSLWRFRKGEKDDFNPDQPAGAQVELMFQEAVADPADFVPLNVAMYGNPESFFRKNYVVNLRTPDGYKGIVNMVYTEKTGDRVMKQTIADEDDRRQILREKFGY